MKKIIEHGKNLAKKIGEKGKKALLVTSTVGMLASGLSGCSDNDSLSDNQEKTKKALNEYNKSREEGKTLKVFTDYHDAFKKLEDKLNKEGRPYDFAPVILHDDDEKTVILFGSSHGGWPRVSFNYKLKNAVSVYSSLEDETQVETEENGKFVVRKILSSEEKIKLVEELTDYMK